MIGDSQNEKFPYFMATYDTMECKSLLPSMKKKETIWLLNV